MADEANRNRIPRRLVYVVDRRAVVDQATAEAEKLRRWLDQDEASADFKARIGLQNASLPISTLRGQHIDNREWLADPTASAVVVGTVDMVGSRVLFSGYGVSPKMRPYHAGLLGADTLVVLDEAHLVPPFEALLKTIARDPKGEFRPRTADGGNLVPGLHLMSLSATGREDKDSDGGTIFRLTEEDRQHPIVKQRLGAVKKLTLSEAKEAKELVKRLAERAWALGTEPRPARVLIYCNSRDDGALKVKEEIEERAKKEKIAIASELLVGGRRVREREALFKWLETHGFVGDRSEAQVPTFLVATSAGEVGVDMDADHMVCDLVEWERMVQRFGRVNRRGGDNRVAIIEVVAAPANKEKKDGETWPERLKRLRKPIDALKGDASPAAIVALKENRSLQEALQKAQTPPPLRPALTRALVDAWSMTSLEEHTGRPEIEPWLRGWVEDDEPQATIVWRRFLPARSGGKKLAKEAINAFFDEAPPQTSEGLEAETSRIVKWLLARVDAVGKAAKTLKEIAASEALDEKSPVLCVLNSKGELDDKDEANGQWTLGALAELNSKNKAFGARLAGRTLVVSSLLGGLNRDGMLDEEVDGEPPALDADETWEPRPFRVREVNEISATGDADWRETYRFAINRADDGEENAWIAVEERRNQPQSEDDRAVARFEQTLADHQSAAARIAGDIARGLKLPAAYCDMLAVAARLHDEGKKASRWQDAFNAPRQGRPYAKTMGPIHFKRLDGYRHEFGSLPSLQIDAAFKALPADLQDLALHLVAAHHGAARPVINTESCEDAPPTALQERARDVALRFARLQRQWGPWGLAWWESLLRAA
ncbi:type I-U CRISPR-associated helicase/endonuclease Cas3, partial [Pseudorhodoplanes sp.]|uniref:type I-G CRISPR-associated helicase/endonuclease Cas3g n=1 Tax=Pseudorhodoplanes sp. TaxID=1934341 RepID=UPI00391B2688